jgi:hypothetical protein
MAAIFLVCLGQFVKMFRLLQFCELKERKLRFGMVNSATFVALADSGDGHLLDRVFLGTYLRTSLRVSLRISLSTSLRISLRDN